MRFPRREEKKKKKDWWRRLPLKEAFAQPGPMSILPRPARLLRAPERIDALDLGRLGETILFTPRRKQASFALQ